MSSIKIINLTPQVIKNVEHVTMDGLRDFVETATAMVAKGSPYDTGNNRSMIDSKPDGKGYKIFSASGYGGYLEFGTARMVARPYFLPALQQTIRDFEDGKRWAR